MGISRCWDIIVTAHWPMLHSWWPTFHNFWTRRESPQCDLERMNALIVHIWIFINLPFQKVTMSQASQDWPHAFQNSPPPSTRRSNRRPSAVLSRRWTLEQSRFFLKLLFEAQRKGKLNSSKPASWRSSFNSFAHNLSAEFWQRKWSSRVVESRYNNLRTYWRIFLRSRHCREQRILNMKNYQWVSKVKFWSLKNTPNMAAELSKTVSWLATVSRLKPGARSLLENLHQAGLLSMPVAMRRLRRTWRLVVDNDTAEHQHPPQWYHHLKCPPPRVQGEVTQHVKPKMGPHRVTCENSSMQWSKQGWERLWLHAVLKALKISPKLSRIAGHNWMIGGWILLFVLWIRLWKMRRIQ